MSDYFFDTEFYESGPDNPIQFISIGIVSEDGDEYYAVSSEFDENSLSDWLKENVVPILGVPPEKRKTIEQIKNEILSFLGDDEDPVFIADYCSYDWVVFCQLFGTMMDLPDHFPKFCLDVQQFKKQIKYDGDLPEQGEGGEHNALSDAKECMKRWEFLKVKKFIEKPFNLKEFKKRHKLK